MQVCATITLSPSFTVFASVSLTCTTGAHSSNVCEAINNTITVYIPKRINMTTHYEARANLALLVHNEGQAIKLSVLNGLHLQVTTATEQFQQEREESATKDKLRKQQMITKRTRITMKKLKKQRDTTTTNNNTTYKGKTGGKNTCCHCKTGCITRKCSCVNNSVTCVQCKCQNCKNPYNPK